MTVVSIVILFWNEAKHKTFLSPWFSLWDRHGSLRIFPLLLLQNAVLYFRLAFLEEFKVWINLLAESSFPARKNSRNSFNWLVSAAIFAANKSTWCWSAPAIPVLEEAAETVWRTVKAVSTFWNTFNFFDYLVIFRHYFTGDGKVSCKLATISDWFPNIKI